MLRTLVFFFFKQKTAYEISSRDWSSDVCSSDLLAVLRQRKRVEQQDREVVVEAVGHPRQQIGRASCRERVCELVEISGVGVSLKKKKKQYDEYIGRGSGIEIVSCRNKNS